MPVFNLCERVCMCSCMAVFKAHLVEASEMEASQGSADNKMCRTLLTRQQMWTTFFKNNTAMDQGKKTHPQTRQLLSMWPCMKRRDMVHGCTCQVKALQTFSSYICMWLCMKRRDIVHGCTCQVKALQTFSSYIYMWLCMKQHDVRYGCMVYTDHAERAAVSCGTSYVTTVL